MLRLRSRDDALRVVRRSRKRASPLAMQPLRSRSQFLPRAVSILREESAQRSGEAMKPIIYECCGGDGQHKVLCNGILRDPSPWFGAASVCADPEPVHGGFGAKLHSATKFCDGSIDSATPLRAIVFLRRKGRSVDASRLALTQSRRDYTRNLGRKAHARDQRNRRSRRWRRYALAFPTSWHLVDRLAGVSALGSGTGSSPIGLRSLLRPAVPSWAG